MVRNDWRSYQFSSNMSKIKIEYGESVLNPYVIDEVEDFNYYGRTLVDNIGLAETQLDKSFRIVKDFEFGEANKSVKTYDVQFYGDIEGNGMDIGNIRIIAETNVVNGEVTDSIGLFKSLGKALEKETDSKVLFDISSYKKAKKTIVGNTGKDKNGLCIREYEIKRSYIASLYLINSYLLIKVKISHW